MADPTILAAAQQPPVVKGTYSEDFGAGFQRHILAIITRVPLFALRYRNVLDPLYFVNAIERLIAQAALTFVDEHRCLPTRATLLEMSRQLCDDQAYPAVKQTIGFLYTDDISDAPGVIQKVIEFGKLQRMCNAVLEAGKRLARGDRNIMSVIREADAAAMDVADVGIDYRSDARQHWYTGYDADEQVPTGITHLDMALGGGALRGGLYVGLSPPKRGKTTLAVNIGFGAAFNAAGYNVVHVSHEINRKRVGIRYDLRLAGSPEIIAMRRSDPEQFAAYMRDRAGKFIQGRLFIQSWPTRMCTPSMLRSYLTMLSGEGAHPDVLIVDYADIMRPERRIGDMRHEQAGIYEDLRGLAGEFDAVCWTFSQAKASALNKVTPDMGDFAEAFEKAAVMDAGVAICQTDDEKGVGRCRLVMIGQRDEADGTTVECVIRRNLCMVKSTALYDPAGALIAGEGSGLPQAQVTQPAPGTNDGHGSSNGNGRRPPPGAGAYNRLKDRPKAFPRRQVTPN